MMARRPTETTARANAMLLYLPSGNISKIHQSLSLGTSEQKGDNNG